MPSRSLTAHLDSSQRIAEALGLVHGRNVTHLRQNLQVAWSTRWTWGSEGAMRRTPGNFP